MFLLVLQWRSVFWLLEHFCSSRTDSCITLSKRIIKIFLGYRHYRYEQKLACLLWKVDMKEVALISTDTSDSCTRTKSLVGWADKYSKKKFIEEQLFSFFKIQTCRPSLISEGTSKRAYTSIGNFRIMKEWIFCRVVVKYKKSAFPNYFFPFSMLNYSHPDYLTLCM